MASYQLPKTSQVTPSFDRLDEGDLVGVLNIRSHRNSIGDAGDAHTIRLQQSGEIDRGSFPFDRRIGGENDFLDSTRLQSIVEFLGPNIRRADSVQGRE